MTRGPPEKPSVASGKTICRLTYVWYGMGGSAPAQAAAVAGGGYEYRRRRKKKKTGPEEVLAELPEFVPPDLDAPLREFIARQEARDEIRKASAPEPPPFDPRPMIEARRLEAERIERERRRRNRARILLLLTE